MGKFIFWLTTLYTVNLGLLFANGGLFFDDWCIANQSWESRYNFYNQLGILFNLNPYAHEAILALPFGMAIERGIAFFAYLIASFFFYGIIKRVPGIRVTDAKWLTILFAICPINFARIQFCAIHYASCIVFFFGGFYIYIRATETKSVFLRIIANVLLVLSYITSSFLFFTFVIPAFIVSQKPSIWRDKRKILKELLCHADLFLLPVGTWIFKNIFYKPFGQFDGYNSPKVSKLINGIPGSIDLLWRWIVQIVNELAALIAECPLLLIIPVAIVVVAFSRQLNSTTQKFSDDLKSRETKNLMLLVAFGLGLFIYAVLPYLAVGQNIAMKGRIDPYLWTTRHQYLWAPGLSIMVYFGILALAKKLNRPGLVAPLLIAVVAFSTVENVRVYGIFLIDEFRQTAMIRAFKKSEDVRSHTTFMMKDDSSPSSARRDYRYYELTAMFNQAFGDETRYAQVSFHSWPPPDSYFGKLKNYPEYYIRQYQVRPPEMLITVTPGGKPLTAWQTTKLWWGRLTGKSWFDEEIDQAVRLQTTPIEGKI